MSADDLPDDLYLDTSLVVAAIVRGSHHSVPAAAFCNRLIDHGSRVYFSQILRLELSEAIRRLATSPDRLPADIRRRHRLDAWSADPRVRRDWMVFGIRQFDGLLARFAETFELPFSLPIWQSSVTVMVDSGLRSLDAIHVATARGYGLRHLATTDDHFSRITDVHVWLIQDTPLAHPA